MSVICGNFILDRTRWQSIQRNVKHLGIVDCHRQCSDFLNALCRHSKRVIGVFEMGVGTIERPYIRRDDYIFCKITLTTIVDDFDCFRYRVRRFNRIEMERSCL